MVIVKKPENTKDTISYETTSTTIEFDDGELAINLKKKERDDPVHLDICRDYTGGLVMGTGPDARAYVAQIDIPAREYAEEEDTEGEGGNARAAVPFSMDKVTLTLWGLED